MSIPLHCPDCGEFIGADDSLFAGFHSDSSLAKITCPGKGKHQPAVRTTERKLFGLIEQITVVYPETHTSSSWNEYAGPKLLFCVWLAIMLGNDRGIIVNGKWCWWNIRRGFFGDGAKGF